jgi:hypothetical protein
MLECGNCHKPITASDRVYAILLQGQPFETAMPLCAICESLVPHTESLGLSGLYPDNNNLAVLVYRAASDSDKSGNRFGEFYATGSPLIIIRWQTVQSRWGDILAALSDQ